MQETGKLKVLELFGGIGAPHKALTNLNKDYRVIDMIENDPKAVLSYNAIHGTDFKPQDVLTWDKDIQVDYLHASTPCQAFSVAGKGGGAEDKRGSILWEHTIRIIKITKPKIITMENVKGLLAEKHKALKEWYLKELEELGYKTEYKILNSKFFGIPQNRERVFFISRNDGKAIQWPENNTVDKCLNDILDKNAKWEIANEFIRQGDFLYTKNNIRQYNSKTIEIDLYKLFNQNKNGINRVGKLKKPLYEDLIIPIKKLKDVYSNNASSFYGTNGINGAVSVLDSNLQKILTIEPINFNEDGNFNGTNGVSGTLTATQPDFKNKILDIENKQLKYRKLTPRETFYLMGFSEEDFNKAIQITKIPSLLKQAGNSIVVPVMEAILKLNI